MSPTETTTKGRPLLPVALGIAVVLAVTMTCISVAIYYGVGYYKFDLSRPGYESERLNVVNNDTQKTYDTTTPLSPSAIDSFLVEYDANVGAIRAYSDFSDTSVLSDKSLLLEPADSTQ
jgi:hypothetical protein